MSFSIGNVLADIDTRAIDGLIVLLNDSGEWYDTPRSQIKSYFDYLYSLDQRARKERHLGGFVFGFSGIQWVGMYCYSYSERISGFRRSFTETFDYNQLKTCFEKLSLHQGKVLGEVKLEDMKMGLIAADFHTNSEREQIHDLFLQYCPQGQMYFDGRPKQVF